MGLWSLMRLIWTGDAYASDYVYNGALDAAASTIPTVVVQAADAVDTKTGRRILGGVQTIAGGAIAAAGAITAPLGIGVPLAAVGTDMAQAGARQTITGEWTPTVLQKVIYNAATVAGVHPDDVPLVTTVGTALVQGAAGGAAAGLSPAKGSFRLQNSSSPAGSAAISRNAEAPSTPTATNGVCPPCHGGIGIGQSLTLLQRYLSGSGGRWGSASTRLLNHRIAAMLEKAGFRVFGGAGRAPEEFIPPPGGGRTGSTYVDISATNGSVTVRVQTVTTRADGVTPTAAELAAAARIQAAFPNDVLILVPK